MRLIFITDQLPSLRRLVSMGSAGIRTGLTGISTGVGHTAIPLLLALVLGWFSGVIVILIILASSGRSLARQAIAPLLLVGICMTRVMDQRFMPSIWMRRSSRSLVSIKW